MKSHDPTFFFLISTLCLLVVVVPAFAEIALDWHTTQYRLEPGYRYYINMHSEVHRLPLHCSPVVARVQAGPLLIQHEVECPTRSVVFRTAVYVHGQQEWSGLEVRYGYGSHRYDTSLVVEVDAGGNARVLVQGQEVARFSVTQPYPLIQYFTESRGVVWRMESRVEITRQPLDTGTGTSTPEQIIGATTTMPTTTPAPVVAATQTLAAAQELAATATSNTMLIMILVATVLLVLVVALAARR